VLFSPRLLKLEYCTLVLMRVQTNPKEDDTEIFWLLLIQDSSIIKLQLLLMSNATTIDVIYSDSLKDVQLPLPPVFEQEGILDEVEKRVKQHNLFNSKKPKESIEKITRIPDRPHFSSRNRQNRRSGGGSMSPEIAEHAFEGAIEQALLKNGPDDFDRVDSGLGERELEFGEFVPGGYHKRLHNDYDRALCLIPRDVIDFIYATQAKEWGEAQRLSWC